MVELLVAMTIGLLLTLVVAQLFLSSRQTYATTDDVSRMGESIRYAQFLFNRAIHSAGYKSAPNSRSDMVFAAPNVVIEGTNGAGTASDTLTIRFQGSGTPADGTALDCLGNRIAAGAMSVNTFSIAPGASGSSALFCDIDGPGGNPPVEVVPNVQNMQILYGEDTNLDLSADRYLPIDNVASIANIVSVRIALLFQTPGASNPVTDATAYTLNEVNLPAFNDRRFRRLVVMNVNLRNRTP
jgi:type IV pilus assembly protein PilW